MEIRDFALERFFAEHEFAARHILAASDVEGMALSELLALADEETHRMWTDLRLGYTESAGLPALRQAIAPMYAGFSADDILVFAGAEEAIFLSMHATLRPGDHVVVIVPAYQSLHEVARSIGCTVTAVPLDPAGWTLDIDRVRSALTPATRMLVINFPHSPTGAHITAAQLDELATICRTHGIRLFSDEVYRLLEHDTAHLLPPAATLLEDAVSLGVMSKSFALAGLRIGWIATRDRVLLRRLAALKDYTTICNSAPSEILALVALRARGAVLGRSRAIIEMNLPVLHDFFERNARWVSWTPPTAGSVCFPRFAAGIDAEAVATELVNRAGVVILPGARFDYEPAYFRVGYGRTDMGEGLRLVEQNLPSIIGQR